LRAEERGLPTARKVGRVDPCAPPIDNGRNTILPPLLREVRRPDRCGFP
jgi:hypothetical protein